MSEIKDATLNNSLCSHITNFATAASLEGALWNKTGNLTNLSVQQMLDCDELIQDCTVEGGSYNYTMKNKIMKWDDFNNYTGYINNSNP